MTRAQVARYLRRSIATVRRAEGRHLHPHRDAKGIFRFDPDEVRELRAALDRDQVRLARVDFTEPCHGRHGSPERNRGELECLDVIATLRRELAELRDVNRTLLTLFYSVCPGRLLSQIDPELLEALDSMAATNATAR